MAQGKPMREYDTEYVAAQFDLVARKLEDSMKKVKRAASDLRKEKNFDAAGPAINDLLWLLPNLGLSAIHSSIVRELEHIIGD